MTTLGDGVSGGDAGEPRAQSQLAQLRQHLQLARLQAGQPSYREISRRTGRAVSHTTASKILRCESVPSWVSLEQVLNALGSDVAAARELWVAVHQPPPAATASSPTADSPDTPADAGDQHRPSTPAPAPRDGASRPAKRARRSSHQSQTTVFTLAGVPQLVGI